jgi:hypothetical protein
MLYEFSPGIRLRMRNDQVFEHWTEPVGDYVVERKGEQPWSRLA